MEGWTWTTGGGICVDLCCSQRLSKACSKMGSIHSWKSAGTRLYQYRFKSAPRNAKKRSLFCQHCDDRAANTKPCCHRSPRSIRGGSKSTGKECIRNQDGIFSFHHTHLNAGAIGLKIRMVSIAN